MCGSTVTPVKETDEYPAPARALLLDTPAPRKTKSHDDNTNNDAETTMAEFEPRRQGALILMRKQLSQRRKERKSRKQSDQLVIYPAPSCPMQTA
jgi:hypothetical protein